MTISLPAAFCALALLSACPSAASPRLDDEAPPAAPPAAASDTDGDGFADADDLCPAVSGPDHGCPRAVETPSASAPAMTSDAARTKLERVVARTKGLYPWFTPDSGPRGLLPAIDAIRVADPATKTRARALVEEVQNAYDALARATAQKEVASQEMIADAKEGQAATGNDGGSRFGGLRGARSSDKQQRFLDAMDAAEAARAASDVADERLVAALRALIASNG